MSDPFLSISAAKTKAKTLQKFLSKEKSLSVQLKDCQEAVAKMHGFANWQTLKGVVEKLEGSVVSAPDLVGAKDALKGLGGVTGTILCELQFILSEHDRGAFNHPYISDLTAEMGKFQFYQAKIDFSCAEERLGLEPMKLVLYRALEFFDELRNALMVLGFPPDKLLFPEASHAMDVLEGLGMPLPPANMKGFAALAAKNLSD